MTRVRNEADRAAGSHSQPGTTKDAAAQNTNGHL